MLFYIRNKGTEKQLHVKVVRGAEEADSIFQEFHDSEAGGHSGKEKTTHAISKRYYWPGMTIDIENWVSFTLTATLCTQFQFLKINEKINKILQSMNLLFLYQFAD